MATPLEAKRIALDALIEMITNTSRYTDGIRLEAMREVLKHTGHLAEPLPPDDHRPY